MTTNIIKTTPCVIGAPDSTMPEVQLLSNGRYHVMVTNAGGGYSRWNNLAITRWNEDATLDNWGTFVYLSSAESREIWSNTYQPTLCKADCYEATFIEGRTIFRCLNHAIETITEIAVSPEDDVEVRRIHIKNGSDRHRNISLTTYAEIVLTPTDLADATPLAVAAHWEPDSPITAKVAIDGLKVNGSYDLDAGSYRGALQLNEFTTTRLERWLAIAKVEIGGTASVTGTWEGSGEVETGKHRGELALSQATWAQEGVPPITAVGSVEYAWPESFETKGLRLGVDEQSVALEMALADGMLELRHFLWSHGADEMAEGTASLPVPGDFAKWRETLAEDTRPLAVSIQSRVLPMELLKQWLPALEQLDPKSTAQVEIEISGNYATPEIDATFQARDLRAPAQPKLPPADMKITLAGRDGRLTVNGEVVAPDFPPAVMTANLPFRPGKWAENPDLLKSEPLDARVVLPRLELSRFVTLVPALKSLAGTLTGNVTAGGTIGKLDLNGSLYLTGGAVQLTNDDIPKIEKISAEIDLALDKVVLKNLAATVAGGSIRGQGTVDLGEGGLGNIDLNLRGDHLPLMRNELLILRANANLRLQGPWETATLSGTAGTVDSIFYRDIELLPIGRPFTGPAAASVPKIDPPKTEGGSIPQPFRDWRLDVMVNTEEPFLVRGNLANGDVTGKIRIGGTIGSPAPDGTLRVRNFKASLPFSTLTVARGTAVFTPANGFDPVLEIRGYAEPRPYRVDVYVYGQASDPQLVLTSNPPLPENEIMTLLATGTTTSGLEDPAAASSRAMQLLIEELRRGRFLFGKQLRPVLGLLDRVDFSLAEADPYSSESYSTATLSITDRWFISAGISDEGDSRTMVVWRFSFR